MDPEAVAIRLSPIRTGPRDLEGTTPLVIFAEQNMTGAAGLAAPAAGQDLAAAGELHQLEVPARSSILGMHHASTQKFEVDDIIFVIDRSGSMGEPLSALDHSPKMNHVKEAIGRLSGDHFPEARISLVVFNDEAVEVPINSQGSFIDLQNTIAEIKTGGDTVFDKAFRIVDGMLSHASKSREFGRKVVIFITDGQDHGSRPEAGKIATMIRDHNAAAFLIGVGADYDIGNIIALATKFGFAGWAHTPSPDPQNAFNFLVPAFLANIQGAEHYLKVIASGPFAAFYGLTPSIRGVDDGRFHIGYQNQGIGVVFTEGTEPALKLEAGCHVKDPNSVRSAIPIIDHREAGAYFDQLQMARDSLGPLLVLRAQLENDRELLLKLQKAYPELDKPIGELLASMNRPGDARSRMDTRTTMSSIGSHTGSLSFMVNPLSRVNLPPQEDPNAPQRAHLHSGGIGPLSGPIGKIPPLGVPNPGAYDKVVPAGNPKLSFNTSSGPQEFELGSMPLEGIIVVGSGSGCELRLNDPSVSPRHLQIRRSADGYYAENLSYRRGTFINERRIWSEAKLLQGDRIRIGRATLDFD